VFAAHPDDELVEAGGTICRLRREDCAVRVMLFSRGGGGLAASGTWKPLVSVAWRH
jgi:LmbE family N-acetylglucosaminyl deacetylase